MTMVSSEPITTHAAGTRTRIGAMNHRTVNKAAPVATPSRTCSAKLTVK